MPQNLSPKLSAQTQKFGIYLDEKRLHWACILRVWNNFVDNFGDSFGDNFGDKFQYLRHRHVTSFIKDFTQKIHIGTYIHICKRKQFQISYPIFCRNYFFAMPMILRKSTFPHRDDIKSLVVAF